MGFERETYFVKHVAELQTQFQDEAVQIEKLDKEILNIRTHQASIQNMDLRNEKVLDAIFDHFKKNPEIKSCVEQLQELLDNEGYTLSEPNNSAYGKKA